MTKYRAFISYSHSDSKRADWLHRGLERYRPPKPLIGTATSRGPVPNRLAPIFRDRDELPSATDLGALINTALQESAAQIVICSPKAAQSKWVNEEILAFKRLGRDDQIFCLIVAGEPNATDMPGRAAEECFPPALRFRLGPDGQLSAQRTEPIAADLRPGKDGEHNAKLKLIAGLLGVGFDALKRREAQRRNRRLVAFSCAAAAGMVLTSGLAVYALLQRAAAQRHSQRAEAEARTARETTRFLVDLFKISDPSEARGNTVTAREMLDKGAARVDLELAREPAIQATLMDTLGTVYMGLGLYAQSQSLLDRAVALRRSLQGIDPLELSETMTHRGDLLRLRAEYAAGEQAYAEAIRLESAKPKDARAQTELADSLYGLGKLLELEGRYADADKNLRRALALQQTLYRAPHPAIARTLKNLASEVAESGDLNAALALEQRAVAMQRQLRGNEPSPDLAEALNDMGVLLESNGDDAGAERFYRESLEMKRRLYGDKHPEIAAGLFAIASVLWDKEDLAGAEALYQQSAAMHRELQGENAPQLGEALFNLASVQYDRGETEQALVNMREVLAIWRKVFPADHPLTAKALNIIGFWLTLKGDYASAERHLQEGLAMRRHLFDEHHPEIASSLMLLAVLKVAEARYPEALQLAVSAKGIDMTALSADHWRTAIAESVEGAALTGLRRFPEAEARLTHSYGILSGQSGAPVVFRTLTQQYVDKLHHRERQMRLATVAPVAARK